jgi:uncharacterized paraquat-inducible protein A
MARLRSARGTFHVRFVLFATLVAFLFQSYVVQTHIHFTASAASGTIVADDANIKTSTASSVAGQHNSKPPIDDPAHCPICQEFLHAGQYLTPAPVLALLITAVFVPITIERAVPVTANPVSHGWRGRAPPSA